jgi:hypothetical protein
MAAKRRSRLALIILLGTVLTITAQIASGLLMAWANVNFHAFHVANGLAAAVFLAGEWLWLFFSPLGRVAAQRIFLLSAESRYAFGRQVRAPLQQGPLREGLGALVEGIFLVLASLTVLFGLLLWQGLSGLLPCCSPCYGFFISLLPAWIIGRVKNLGRGTSHDPCRHGILYSL